MNLELLYSPDGACRLCGVEKDAHPDESECPGRVLEGLRLALYISADRDAFLTDASRETMIREAATKADGSRSWFGVEYLAFDVGPVDSEIAEELRRRREARVAALDARRARIEAELRKLDAERDDYSPEGYAKRREALTRSLLDRPPTPGRSEPMNPTPGHVVLWKGITPRIRETPDPDPAARWRPGSVVYGGTPLPSGEIENLRPLSPEELAPLGIYLGGSPVPDPTLRTIVVAGDSRVRLDSPGEVLARDRGTVETLAETRGEGEPVRIFVFESGSVLLPENSTIRASDTVRVRAGGDARVSLEGAARGEVEGRVEARVDGNAFLRARGDARVLVRGYGRVEGSERASVTLERFSGTRVALRGPETFALAEGGDYLTLEDGARIEDRRPFRNPRTYVAPPAGPLGIDRARYEGEGRWTRDLPSYENRK